MRTLIQIGYYDALHYEATLAALLESLPESQMSAIDLEEIRQLFQRMIEQEAAGEDETVVQLDSSELGYSVYGREKAGLIPLPPEFFYDGEAKRVWRMIERKLASFPDAERFYIPVDALAPDKADRLCGPYTEHGWDVTYIEQGEFALFTRIDPEQEATIAERWQAQQQDAMLPLPLHTTDAIESALEDLWDEAEGE